MREWKRSRRFVDYDRSGGGVVLNFGNLAEDCTGVKLVALNLRYNKDDLAIVYL